MELAQQAKVQKILKCARCLMQICRHFIDYHHPLPIISYLAHVYFPYHLSRITCLLAGKQQLAGRFIGASPGHNLVLLQTVSP